MCNKNFNHTLCVDNSVPKKVSQGNNPVVGGEKEMPLAMLFILLKTGNSPTTPSVRLAKQTLRVKKYNKLQCLFRSIDLLTHLLFFSVEQAEPHKILLRILNVNKTWIVSTTWMFLF